MKKLLIVLLSVLALSFVVSCTTYNNHGVAISQNKKVKGKNGIKRPDWVIYDQSNRKEHFATGYGKGMTFETSKMKAKLNADSELAMWINTSVESIRDRYVEENISEKDSSYLDTFVLAAKEAGQAVLTGITEVDYWEDNEGGVWVLEVIPVKNVKAQIKNVIKTTAAKTNLFTTVSAEDVMKKLDAALDAYFPEG